MATRPVFIIKSSPPYYEMVNTEFIYYSGFAESQQRKSVESLHNAYHLSHPKASILEVSTRSPVPLGQLLSAFNLKYNLSGTWYPVENIFQSSKVFKKGGPYLDILDVPPYVAKKDDRLHESGDLDHFYFQGVDFELEPKTFFYDWIYITALSQNHDLSERIIAYDAFTDIAFNPQKSLNCQARSAAVYVSLFHSGLLSQALKSVSSFKEMIYGDTSSNIITEQLSLF